MSALDDELRALRLTFYEEAEERLAELESSLLALERSAGDPDLLNAIFRAVHSIKGGSAACDHDELASFSHAYESLLASLRKGLLSVNPKLLDVLLQSKDVLSALLMAAREGKQHSEEARVARAVCAIREQLESSDAQAASSPDPELQDDLSAGFAIWDEEPEPLPTRSASPPRFSFPPPSSAARRASVAPASSAVRIAEPAPPAAAVASLQQATLRGSPSPTRADRALDGVIVRVGFGSYILPTMQVECFLRPTLAAMSRVPSQGTLLQTQYGTLPLLELELLLGLALAPRRPEERVAVLLRIEPDTLRRQPADALAPGREQATQARHVALLVDEVLLQGNFAVKSLERNLGPVRGVLGAVLLDDTLALVLEPRCLLTARAETLLDPDQV